MQTKKSRKPFLSKRKECPRIPDRSNNEKWRKGASGSKQVPRQSCRWSLGTPILRFQEHSWDLLSDMVWMFVSPNSHVVILMLNAMVLGSGVLGMWLGHEGLMDGVSVLVKEIPTALPRPNHHVRTQWEVCNPEVGRHPAMLAPSPILPASKTVRNRLLLFPVHGILF